MGGYCDQPYGSDFHEQCLGVECSPQLVSDIACDEDHSEKKERVSRPTGSVTLGVTDG